MRLEKHLKLSEDTLKAIRGDDNLLAILRIDTDDEGDYWEVIVMDTKTDKRYSEKRFRDEKKAEKELERVVKEF